MKLPCAVTRDLLPLYAEKMVEPETRNLVEQHLTDCPACREKLSALNTDTGAPVETAKPLQSLKKQLRKRRWYAAAIAALCVFVAVFTYFFHENEMKLVPWEEGLMEVRGIEARPVEDVRKGDDLPDQNEATVDVLVIRADSRINGYEEAVFVDEDGISTVILRAWSVNYRGSGTNREYSEQVYYPVPDRLIYDDGDQNHLLWGEPMNGGVEVLPRLALGFYLWAALLLAVVLGLLWRFLRGREYSWIPRQLFFAPVSYVTAHFLIKGGHSASFFLWRDLIGIALITLALYALFSLAWQVWLEKKTSA